MKRALSPRRRRQFYCWYIVGIPRKSTELASDRFAGSICGKLFSFDSSVFERWRFTYFYLWWGLPFGLLATAHFTARDLHGSISRLIIIPVLLTFIACDELRANQRKVLACMKTYLTVNISLRRYEWGMHVMLRCLVMHCACCYCIETVSTSKPFVVTCVTNYACLKQYI